MTNKEKLACLMAQDSFEEWNELLESDKVRKFISDINGDETEVPDLKFIRECIKDGILLSNIKFMLPLFIDDRIYIKRALLNSKTEICIKHLIERGLEAYKIAEICDILGGKITEELINLLKKNFDEFQVEHICKGVLYGLTIQQIKVYAKENFGYELMSGLRELLVSGYPINKVKLIANPHLTLSQFRILVGLVEKGISYSKLKVIMGNVETANDKYVLCSVVECFECGMKIKDVQEIMHLSYRQIDAIRYGFEQKFPESYKAYCMKFDLDKYQFDGLARAYHSNIDEDIIAMIMNAVERSSSFTSGVRLYCGNADEIGRNSNTIYYPCLINRLVGCVVDHNISKEHLNKLVSVVWLKEKFEKLYYAISTAASEEEIDKIIASKITTREQILLDRLLEE